MGVIRSSTLGAALSLPGLEVWREVMALVGCMCGRVTGGVR